MKRITSLLAIVAVAMMTMVGSAARQSKDTRAETALAAAIKIETIDGKPEAAITAYKDIAQKYPNERTVVAQALMRMGQCYEKLGAKQAAEARQAYQLVVSTYGDQAEVATRAKARLAAMESADTSSGARMLGRFGAPGRELRGISADGRYLYVNEVASTPTSRDRSDAVVAIDLTMQTQRTVLPSVAIGPGEVLTRTIAPDGKQVAHTLTPSSRGECAVSIAASTTATPKQIAKLEKFDCYDTTWASNSERMLIWGATSPSANHFDFILLDARTGRTLWRLGHDASNADWANAAISPNGRFIALEELVRKDQSEITVSDSQTGSTSRLLRGSNVGAPVWTADGRALVFIEGAVGSRNLYSVPVSESGTIGTPQLIKTGLGNVTLFQSMKDGSLLYRTRPEAEAPKHYLATLDANGVAKSAVLVADIRRVCGVEWMPDSRAIVYGARLLKEYAETVPCTLLVIRPVAGGEEKVLSPGMSEIRRPKVSPDGNSVAVFGRKDGVPGAYVIDLKSGSARLIAEAAPNQTASDAILSADWSADGKGLYLYRLNSEAQQRVERIVYRDLQTGQETVRYTRSGPGRIFGTVTSVAPDGRLLLLLNEMENGAEYRSVVVLPANGGAPQTVLKTPIETRSTWASFSGDGRSITVARVAAASGATGAYRKELLRLPATGGDLKPTGMAAEGLDNHYASPDGTRMFFSTFASVANEVQIWTMRIK